MIHHKNGVYINFYSIVGVAVVVVIFSIGLGYGFTHISNPSND
jgi:hypothetical protein